MVQPRDLGCNPSELTLTVLYKGGISLALVSYILGRNYMLVVKKLLDGFVKCISILLMLLVAGIVLLMLNELVLRNLLGSSFKGMTELSGFMFFLWMAFF